MKLTGVFLSAGHVRLEYTRYLGPARKAPSETPGSRQLLQETNIVCPYCGEVITILLDSPAEEQQYIEDCQVCCRPMDIRVNLSADGYYQVEARSEND